MSIRANRYGALLSSRRRPLAILDISTIPNMTGWWKADSITGIADGGTVQSWADSGPGKFPAEQSNSGICPTFQAAVLNGKPVVRFSNDRLVSNVSASDPNRTIFSVVKPTNITTISSIIGSSSQGGLQFRIYSDGKLEFLVQSIEGTTRSNSSVTASNFQIATGSFASSGGYNYWINGTASGGGTIGRGLDSNQVTILGAHAVQNDEFFNGDIAEIIEFSRVLSASERAQVHSYLQDKYAVTTSDYVSPGGTAPVTRTNLTVNPSFENNVTDGGYTYGSTTAQTRDTSNFFIGAASLKVYAQDEGSDLGMIVSFGALEAGSYTFSGWMKTENVTNNATFVIRRLDTYATIGTEHHVVGTTGWTRKQITFTAPGGAQIEFVGGIGSYGTSSAGTVWFDGLLMEVGTELKPYFDGSYSQAGKSVSWNGAAHNSTSRETQ